jgi:hypothetical protein
VIVGWVLRLKTSWANTFMKSLIDNAGANENYRVWDVTEIISRRMYWLIVPWEWDHLVHWITEPLDHVGLNFRMISGSLVSTSSLSRYSSHEFRSSGEIMSMRWTRGEYLL